MQYNSEVYTHQRVKKNMNGNENRKYVFNIIDGRLILCFICALCTSRVLMINLTAPFGIAFFIAVVFSDDIVEKLLIAIGTTLGYISLCNEIKNFYIYIIVTITIAFFSIIINSLSHKKQEVIYFAIAFIELTTLKTFSQNLTLNVSIISTVLELLCIIPAYYVIEFSLCCYNSLNTRHLFSSEEIINMAITLALVIAGTRGIVLFGISIRNIIALSAFF